MMQLMEGFGNIGGVHEKIPHFGIQKNHTTRASEDIIGSSGYIVEFEPETSNTISQGIFSADFVCSIDSKRFTVRLTGEVKSLTQLITITGGRVNPLLKNGRFDTKELIPMDISPDIVFELLDTNGQIIKTHLAFWNEFRKRIPVTHPLSTI